MADTVTPKLGLTKPEVGASDDTWGGKLNANMDILDAATASIKIQDAPPSAPWAGQMWWESDTGITYMYYNDGNTSQWVQISGGGISDAPADDLEYLRKNGSWTRPPGWRVIADINLASAIASTTFAIPTDISTFRITGRYIHGQVTTQLAMRFSTNGGVSYDSGVSYTLGLIAQSGAVLSASGSNTNQCYLSGSADGAGYLNTTVDALVTLATGALSAAYTARAQGHSATTGPTNSLYGGQYVGSTTRATHAQLLSIASGNLGAGTRLIVEGV